MLLKRVITAIIGIIAAVFIIHYGGWLFAATVLLLTLLAWHEYYNMMTRLEISIAYYIGILGILLLWGSAWLGNSREILAVLLMSSFLILAKMVLSYANFTVRDAVYTLSGLIYIGLTFPHLILLRFMDNSLYIPTQFGTLQAGTIYLWLAIVGTWASDTLAFFVGSQFGRHKLAPAVSPGKTWEGGAGGIAGSILAVTGLGTICDIPLAHSLVIGGLVGIVGPLGDLVESAIKRSAGVKDSGRLLPGHGGVLDRFDSVMFTAPTVYYYIYAFLS
ncbi:MAG TPA: phosphatidate cytidylyltransferase [Selenomonadales bacterium]|nr:phosphatidate cytidylyltransferase [Selenomonadales bacterium]